MSTIETTILPVPAVRAFAPTSDHRPTSWEAVTVDIYRDVHKGIRAELFAVTEAAGRTDAGDAAARQALAAHVRGLVGLLDEHAEHEDVHIGAVLAEQLPELHERVEGDHADFERQTQTVVALAAEAAASTGPDARRLTSRLYGDLAAFTGVYLLHQEVEERIVMPALEAAIGFPATLAVNQAIVASIPPDRMAASLALMIPAMNVDDRTELLGGMQAGAPPEVFAGVWSLVGSVLDPADTDALARRLGIA